MYLFFRNAHKCPLSYISTMRGESYLYQSLWDANYKKKIDPTMAQFVYAIKNIINESRYIIKNR